MLACRIFRGLVHCWKKDTFGTIAHLPPRTSGAAIMQAVRMTFEQFESYSLIFGIGALILFMGFIVWDLAKKSKAGRFGSFILFFALGLGVVGFLIKTILVELIEK